MQYCGSRMQHLGNEESSKARDEDAGALTGQFTGPSFHR